MNHEERKPVDFYGWLRNKLNEADASSFQRGAGPAGQNRPFSNVGSSSFRRPAQQQPQQQRPQQPQQQSRSPEQAIGELIKKALSKVSRTDKFTDMQDFISRSGLTSQEAKMLGDKGVVQQVGMGKIGFPDQHGALDYYLKLVDGEPARGNNTQMATTKQPNQMANQGGEPSSEPELLQQLGFPRWPQDGDRVVTQYGKGYAGTLHDVQVRIKDERGQILPQRNRRILAKVKVSHSSTDDKQFNNHDSLMVGYDDDGIKQWKWDARHKGWIAPADSD